eukprot:scaffold7328_cov314-Pinguiococcus_pyrenoidosus.AAC.52
MTDNITEGKREPVGGAARMVGLMRRFYTARNPPPLVLFSGDAFAPSIMSTVLKGVQMPPVLNQFDIQVACIGNHDFDFGVEKMAQLISKTNFPWLLSNVQLLDETADNLFKDRILIEWEGYRIGLMGLVEGEWVDTLGMVDPEDLVYFDFVTVGNRIAAELREAGAEIVIALTHMRVPNDERLAQEGEGIDLILGGHDHDYVVFQADKSAPLVVKSGTDFREFTPIRAVLKNNRSSLTPQEGDQVVESGGLVVAWHREEVNSQAPVDARAQEVVDSYAVEVTKRMDKTVGYVATDLDARFATIRNYESNVGNFLCDVVTSAVDCDFCVINSGTLRADQIIPAGEFKVGDLLNLLPMVDEMVCVELTPQQIHDLLENAVSKWPRLEGRFLQVSEVTFTFDPSKDPGDRVVKDSVRVKKQPLDPSRTYRCCTKEYLRANKDGYSFGDAPVVLTPEQIPFLANLVQNYFTIVDNLNSGQGRDSFIRRKSKQMVEDMKLDAEKAEKPNQESARKRRKSINPVKIDGVYRVAPAVEGRIKMVE